MYLIVHNDYFRKPGFQRRSVSVFCSEPGKISKIDVVHTNEGVQYKKPILNPKTGRLMVYSYRDFKVITTVKDKEGRTFDNTSSLNFQYKFSEDDIIIVGKPAIIKSYPSQEVPSIHIPIRSKISAKYFCFLMTLSNFRYTNFAPERNKRGS